MIHLKANQPIIKGKPYYFAVTSYAINYDALIYKDDPTVAVGDTGDYYLDAFAFAQGASNIRTINSIVAGEDQNNPPVPLQPANQISGHSSGNVGYDVVDVSALTNNQYEITFFKDSSSTLYTMYWKMINTLTDSLLIDSSKTYVYDEDSVAVQVIDGFIPNVEETNAAIGSPVYTGTQWYTDFYDESDPDDVNDGTGVTYVGTDIISDRTVPTFPGQCPIITADQLRRVELRFTPGKAYRYINGYLSVFALNSFRYAPGLTPADTVGRGPIGNWDYVHDRPNGWVDVPFTAWSVDEYFGTEQQLAVGYVERARNITYPNGMPDGVWNPTTNLLATGEIIIIFDSPYDPNGGENPYDPNSGGQIEFTGGAFSTPEGEKFVWADLTKTSASAKRAPDDATNITEEQRTIFNSKWFNTLYVVGFQRAATGSFYTEGDELTIPISVYPYTEEDVYQFMTSTSTITSSQQQEMWNKVNVYPNPLYGYNELSSYYTNTPDEPYVTFTNLPEQVTIKIYSLSGSLLKTLTTDDKASPSSPFLNWNLLNESGLRVASGMYLAIVSSPIYGDKTLKFAIIMPQKQIQRF